MKRISVLFFFVLGQIGANLISGCSSTNAVGSGSMAGYVLVVDSNSIGQSGIIGAATLNNSGAIVSIDGTSFSTLTDSTGRWDLKNVPAGTYNISFAKNGYALRKRIAYHFVGNGSDYLGHDTIYQIAKRNTTLTLRAFADWTDNNNLVDTNITDSLGFQHTVQIKEPKFYPNEIAQLSSRVFENDPNESVGSLVIILFGRTQQLSPTDPNSYEYVVDNTGSIETIDPNGYSLYPRRSQLLRAGFNSNDQIFCQAFASNIYFLITQGGGWSSSNVVLTFSYTDIITGRQVYTTFGNNHSEVKSFILP